MHFRAALAVMLFSLAAPAVAIRTIDTCTTVNGERKCERQIVSAALPHTEFDSHGVTGTPPPSWEGLLARRQYDDLMNAYRDWFPGFVSQSAGGGGANVARASQSDACTDDADGESAPASFGNPIRPSTGSKIDTVVDFSTPGEMPLHLTRTYDALVTSPDNPLFSIKWSSNFDLRLLAVVGTDGKKRRAHRGNGGILELEYRTTPSAAWWDKHSRTRLVQTAAGWTLHHLDGSVETYDASGRILGQNNRRGVGLTFHYRVEGQPGTHLLERVTHSNGRSLRFEWQHGTTGWKMVAMRNPVGEVYQYAYDLHGKLQSVQPPATAKTIYHYSLSRLVGKSLDGVRIATYAYDAIGRAISTENAGGANKHTFAYTDGANDVSTVVHTNPLGKGTTLVYRKHKLVSATGHAAAGCAAGYREITYDANGHEDLVADFAANFTDYDYSPAGDLLKKTEAAGTPIARTTTYARDAAGRVTTITMQGQLRHDYVYRSDGLLDRQTTTNLASHGVPGQARTTTFRYTFHPNKLVATLTIDGPLVGAGDATTATFDAVGNLVREQNGLGHVVAYANHDVHGQAGRVTGVNGGMVDRTFDREGRVLTISRWKNGVASITRQAWTARGELASVTTPDGVRTQHAYDVIGRLVETTRDAAVASPAGYDVGPPGFDEVECYSCEEPEWTPPDATPPPATVDFQRFTYNANSQVVSAVVGRRSGTTESITRTTALDYDALGRLIRERGAGGRVRATHAYDEVDNRISTTDAVGRRTTFAHDALGRVVASVDAIGGRTAFAYDAADRLVQVTDPRNVATRYVYDGFGQLLAQHSPDSGTTTFQYAATGLATRLTRADGTWLAYTHDGAGRVIRIADATNAREFVYDACAGGNGKVCKANVYNAGVLGSWTHFAWSPFGELTQKRESVYGSDHRMYFTTDGMGRTTGMTYPSGVKVRYAYAGGVLSGMYADPGTGERPVATHIQHAPFGGITEWRHGNGLVRRQSFDLDGRITGISVRDAASVKQSLTYQHDAADNITRITNGIDAALTQQLGYDPMNRLYAVNTSTAFAYDAVGNRFQRREHNQHTAYAIAADSNRLLSSSGQFPGSFTTNANGNITHYRNPDGAQNAVTYDAFDRMATHTRAGVVTQYAYDAFDQRVAKRTGNAAPTRFINDGHRILAELGSDGRWINYLWIGGQLVGQMHGVHLDAIHTDQLGRPEVMTDAAKTVRWRAANWPFDRKAVAGYALNAISIGLPGQYYDVESGLWHNGYRYYADWLGRYLQTDPIGLGGGLNTYGYVSGNPTARVDPWGLTELNLFNPQERAFHERAALYQSPIGIFTVAGHGSPGFMEGADARAMSTSALAAQIMAHPKFSDAQQLQLASCNTGKGAASIAQQLANETGKPVTAPNNFLFFRSNGSFYLGDAHPFKGTYVQGTSGDWVTFYPRTGP